MLLLLVMACGVPPEAEVEAASCEGDDGAEVPFLVQPYIQEVGSDGAWVIWETLGGEGSRVDFGVEELDATACGQVAPLLLGVDPTLNENRVHEVQLSGLSPDTLYRYRVRTGAAVGETLSFRTAAADEEAPRRWVVLSDTQHDLTRMDKWREVAQDGVMAWVEARYAVSPAEAVEGVLVPGDLVDNGWIQDEWRNEFFGPAAPLAAQVPIYPAMGNHDGESPYYFQYFHLPENGDAERTYWLDRGNTRVVALDSNGPFDNQAQLDWLAGVLDSACADDALDFVLVQQHHPYRSELWVRGESSWSGSVVALLDEFSSTCGKPAVNLYGHTHGYGRGASVNAPTLLLNVASGGGAIDRWGSSEQIDYPEFTVAQDTWGFVMLETEGGDAPVLRVERVSRGNGDTPEDNVVTDSVTVYRYPAPPATPTVSVAELDAESVTLQASAYASATEHASTQWQAAADCTDFSMPAVDTLRQSRNEWGGVDLSVGVDLTREAFAGGAGLCFRVRYRDAGMAWSEWSAGVLAE